MSPTASGRPEREGELLSSDTASHGTQRGWILSAGLLRAAAGQRRCVVCAAFEKVPPRQGHLRLREKDVLLSGGMWCLRGAGRGLRAQVPVCVF